MDNLKYKLFQFGVYGTEICQFSEEELRSLIFDIEVEILDSQTFQNLNAKFSMVYFIYHKNEILEKHGITKENVQNINITEILNNHYIKMNTFAWLNKIEILNEYHNTPLTIIFNALVTSNDFLQCNKSVVTMKYKKDELETVCNRLCADGYMQSKQEKNKMMYKLTRTIGHIDLYTENNTKTPFYTVVRINNLVESRSDGITTPEIATFLGVNSKAALRDVVRLLKINNNILQFLEVEGKMKRYRYFTKSSYDAYNKKAEQRTVNNSILRKDKLFVLDEMIKNKLPFAISKDWCTKLAEKLNLQYVPDTKNFKKLCIEAGYLIKSIHNDSGAGNYVNVVYTEGMEINEDDFRDARIGSTKKAVLKQPKSAFLKCFLSSKLFLAMDNGYIANESERVRKLESMLNANMIERTELTINQEFIDNLTLNDFLSLIYYPMRLYIREYNEQQTLYEREYITKTDCQLVDLSMKIECLKIYENFEFTRLSHITNPQSFEKLLVHIDKNCFTVDVEDNLVTVKLNNTNVESCDDTQNDNAYFFEVLNEYSKTVPHIEMEKRMEFCDIAKNLGITTDFEKLQRFIDENCSVYVYDALMTCFRDYVHAELPKNKIDEWSTLPSTKLVNLYNEVKRNIIEHECILPAFFATTDRYTTAKVLNMLKSDTIVVIDNKTKNVSYNEVYKKLFARHAYKSMFPRKYYLNGIPEFADNSYENKILNYITNLLIIEGSVDIEKLCQKIRILSVDEIIAIANLQTDLLQICETENAKYLSLRLDL